MLIGHRIGEDWAQPPDNTTIWPQHILVDWVRVYRRKQRLS